MNIFYIVDNNGKYTGNQEELSGSELTINHISVKPPAKSNPSFELYFDKASGVWNELDPALVTVDGLRLNELKKTSTLAIYAAIEKAYENLLTVKHQEKVYEIKAAEADAYIAAAYPISGTDYPTIAAEAAAMGQTKRQVADLIISARKAWFSMIGTIEGIRRTGQREISLANDTFSVEKAKMQALAGLDAL